MNTYHRWRRDCSYRSCCPSGCSLSGRRAFSSLLALSPPATVASETGGSHIILFPMQFGSLAHFEEWFEKADYKLSIMRRWVTDQQNWLTGRSSKSSLDQCKPPCYPKSPKNLARLVELSPNPVFRQKQKASSAQ